MRGVLTESPADGELNGAKIALVMLHNVLVLRGRCASCWAYYYQYLIVEVARGMEEQIEVIGKSDALKSDASAVQAGSRKRRVDEDFKTAVCIASMASKKAKTVGAMVKATGDFAPTTALGWMGPQRTVYRCETLINFGNAKTVSPIFDATRFGVHKVATLAIAFSHCR